MAPELYPNTPDSKIMKNTGLAILAVMLFVGGIITGRSVEGLQGFKISDLWNDTTTIGGDLTGESIDADINFNLFWTVWNTMEDRYVDPTKIEDEARFYDAIKGMVSSSGDAHTVFLDPNETSAFNSSNAGKYFSGIGAELGYANGIITVIAPLKGSPAIAAGIRPGDRILAVDGVKFTSNETIFDAVSKIRGEKGSEVVLTVLHKDGAATEDITIVRDDITVPSMDYLYDADTGVATIEVSRFTESTLSGWQAKWDQMVDKALADDADAVVLDLRGNPGGFMDAAIYAAGEFLEEGSIVTQQKDRQGHIRDSKVLREGRMLNMPVAILINEASASASEILAGALQKNGRAVVIGEESYGKGTAQEVVEFPDGSSLHITVLKWLLPDGTWLNPDNKIVPDMVVELTDEDFKAGDDTQMDKAVKELTK